MRYLKVRQADTETKPTWFPFYELPTLVRFNETESSVAITRG